MLPFVFPRKWHNHFEGFEGVQTYQANRFIQRHKFIIYAMTMTYVKHIEIYAYATAINCIPGEKRVVATGYDLVVLTTDYLFKVWQVNH